MPATTTALDLTKRRPAAAARRSRPLGLTPRRLRHPGRRLPLGHRAGLRRHRLVGHGHSPTAGASCKTPSSSRGLSSPAMLSFVGGLSTGLVGTMTVVNSWLIRSLGLRCAGWASWGFREVLSSFRGRENLELLFFMSGALLGVGIRRASLPSFIPAQYFQRQNAGSSSRVAISFGIAALVRRLNVAWAYCILGLTILANGASRRWPSCTVAVRIRLATQSLNESKRLLDPAANSFSPGSVQKMPSGTHFLSQALEFPRGSVVDTGGIRTTPWRTSESSR